ncbi:MAG: RecQ family ATP-dependent DNA helicase [Eubacterium sp.]|nr:RecQ family ATP-dependent DNA helicase [Eubacterium sp.]
MDYDYVKLLREMLHKEDAEFREDQEIAIRSVVEGKRTLVVEKTGWGKSIVYFLSTKILRSQGKGITLIVSPLLSLMKDQIEHAREMGLEISTINSQNIEEHEDIYDKLRNGQGLDALLISPERLANKEFRDVLLSITDNVGLFVVDEAHCISDWGHDFRPDYRRIVEIINRLPSTVPVLATTATANDRVVEDIRAQLPGIEVIRGSLMRESLSIQTINIESIPERLAWIGRNIDKFDGPGIIYCSTVDNCRVVNDYLKKIGKCSEIYVGKMDADERQEVIRRFKENDHAPDKINVLVATIALGMGFDMPNLKYVIHFERPSNIIAYYQQIGRAGRDIPEAYAIMLYGEADSEVQEFFIKNAFPKDQLMEDIISLTINNQARGTKRSEYEARINAKSGAIKDALDFLEVEGDIYKEDTSYYKTTKAWSVDKERISQVTERKYIELDQLKDYSVTKGCYMKYLANALDDKKACDCGKCSNCRKKDVLDFETPSDADIRVAEAIFKNNVIDIEPRKKWPNVEEILTMVGASNSNIPKDKRTEIGICLSRYGSYGYGKEVRDGKYRDEHFSDNLVDASESILRDFVRDNNITWVTCVASLNHPTLVKSFAQRLADKLGLPFKEAIVKTQPTRQQKEFNNSVFQMKNAYESFGLNNEEFEDEVTREIIKGNVLLIDDMVDSKWTFTVCGYKLINGGSGKVYPFALADTSNTTD